MTNDTIERPLAEWAAEDAIEFSLAADGSLEAAADRLMASLDPAVEVLGFGEPLHGGEEVLLLRNRLFQHLAQRHGFSAISVESSLPRGRLVNDYIAGRGPTSYDTIREEGFGHGFGQFEANRELVEWMRRRNEGLADERKLSFYGFDIPVLAGGMASPRQTVEFVLNYLESSGEAVDAERRRQIDELIGDDAEWENPAAMVDPEQAIGISPEAALLRVELENLATHLRTRRPGLAARGESSYAEAEHYVTVARQLLSFHAAVAAKASSAELLAIRDLSMADNAQYIAGCERARGRVLLFAHNAHLQRGRAGMPIGGESISWWAAGSHLDRVFGSRYAVIGAAVGASEDNGIGSPEAGTLEAMLTASPADARFIPTHGGRGLSPSEIGSLHTRSRSVKNPSYLPLGPQSFTDFDALAVLNRATYSRGGRPLE